MPETVAEAISEAVDAAVGISNHTQKPAAAEADVAGMIKPEVAEPGADTAAETVPTPTPGPDPAVVEAGDTAMEETTPSEVNQAAPVTESGVGGQSITGQTNGTPGSATAATRLFVGCVPYQFSEDDLKAYFEPVSTWDP